MSEFLKISAAIFFISSFNVLSQEVREIRIDKKYPPTSEIFTVLISDTTIRHGSYAKLEFSYAQQAMDTVISGFFKNGLKDSLWSYYYDSELEARGLFKNDKEVGLWEYYEAEVLMQKYNFSADSLVFFRPPYQQNDDRIITENDTISAKLDRPVLYIGGRNQLYKHIFKSVQYPEMAKRNNIEGNVIVTFVVDSTGKAVNHKVTKGFNGTGLNEEAMRVIQSIPARWLPGILNGKPVNVEYSIPISFRLR